MQGLLKGTDKMGYTHYFPHMRDFTDTEWAEVQTAVKAILATAQDSIALAWEYNEPKMPPQIDAEQIRFNGVGDKGHETFIVTRKLSRLAKRWDYYATQLQERGFVFIFCKTAYKPYDTVVTAVLSAINHIAPGALDIDSDGEPSDWRRGVALANLALNKYAEVPNPIEILRARQRAAELDGEPS